MSAVAPVSSRHRTDMATIFDVFCEVGCPDSGDLPSILTRYPEDYNDESVLRSIRQFSFPCGVKDLDIEAVQLFSFVLTDSDGKFTFGFCRYTPRSNTCLCMLSGFAWPNVFYKMLNHISLVMNNASQSDLDTILTRIYHTDLPNVGDVMTFDCCNGTQRLEVSVPDLSRLPTLRDDKFMLEYFNAVNQKQMLAIYASLLKERRIIFTSRKLSQLSSCIYAVATMLYPMVWQSVFIPVLPSQLADMLMAPMPFLIGVPKQVLQASNMRDLGDVVIVDLEEKTLQASHDDLATLPAEVVYYLKGALKNSSDMGDSMARSFLRANVLLFGGYRLGFVRNEATGNIVWDKEQFVREQKPAYQPFLSSLIGADGVQYLERFIEEKVKALNSGIPIPDEFEKEITNMEGRFKSQVKENATDVIGALKGKVSGIQIGSKLTKLTPKEIRRSKNRTQKKPTKNGMEPLSFDNLQWHEPTSSGSSREPSPKSDEVLVANLIDLDSPVPTNTEVAAVEFDPFRPLGTNAGQSTFYAPRVPPRPHPQPQRVSAPVPPSSLNPFVDPFVSPEGSTHPAVPPSWEKFE